MAAAELRQQGLLYVEIVRGVNNHRTFAFSTHLVEKRGSPQLLEPACNDGGEAVVSA